MSQLVLVTGSSGRIGRAAVVGLQNAGHRVRGFDRVASPGFADTFLGDLCDRTALDRAMKDVDSLIHLAACPDDDDFLLKLLPSNITGLYHVMESARAAGVRRIVLASSGQVNWWQQKRGPAPIKPEDLPSPRYWYGATKMFMESIGRGFSEIHGMSVIIVRLGWCPRTPEQVAEIASSEWGQGLYLSPGDAGRFFACCVSAHRDLRHAIVYAASKSLGVIPFDMTSAKALLGYEPKESWPTGSDLLP